MEYRMLNNQVRMPMLGLGTWDLRGKECEESIRAGLELGYRLIDTAQMYGNEREVGKAMKASRIPRDELFLTTKIYRPDTTYEKAKQAIDRSLRELDTDYIDLLLIHEPYNTAQEMYRAMKEAYQEGKLRAVGVSNFNAGFYRNFLTQCGIIPAVNQVEAHVLFQREELRTVLEEHGTLMEAWSPFAAGKRDFFSNLVLTEIGEQYGKSAAQVALRFLLQRGIAVIPKAGKLEHLHANLEVFDFALSAADMRKIKQLDEKKSQFGWYAP